MARMINEGVGRAGVKVEGKAAGIYVHLAVREQKLNRQCDPIFHLETFPGREPTVFRGVMGSAISGGRNEVGKLMLCG